MALLQVRNFPDEIYEEVSDMAKSQRRSISQQAILLIERGLEFERAVEKQRRTIERAIARKTTVSMKSTDAAAMIREDRDR